MLSFRKKFRVACIVVLTLIIVTTPFLTYRSVGLYVSPTSNREGSLISNITLTTYNSMEFKEPTEGKTPIFLTRHPETIKYHGIDLMSLVSKPDKYFERNIFILSELFYLNSLDRFISNRRGPW